MTVLSYGINELISDLDTIIPAVKMELSNRINGVQGNGNEQQLKLILDELENIKTMAKQNLLPSKTNRWTAFSRYVVDEWDPSYPLGKQLCKLADNYKIRLP